MIKSILLKLLYHSGLLRLGLHRYRDTIPILMIHGVMDTDPSQRWQPGWERLSIAQLNRSLQQLRRYFTFISLSEAVAMLRENVPLRPGSMVLTFDDGYANNFSHALPVLQKYDVPACFYLTTGNIQKGEPYWIDRLDYVLQQCREAAITVEIGTISQAVELSDRDSYIKSFKALRLKLKSTYTDDRELQKAVQDYCSLLEAQLDDSLLQHLQTDPWASLVSPTQLSNLPNGVELGSHTVNHWRVDQVDPDELKPELLESRQFIETHSGKPCIHFCYPNGNYASEAAQQLHACGYESATTTDTGTNLVGTDPYRLRRLAFPTQKAPESMLFYLLRQMRKGVAPL